MQKHKKLYTYTVWGISFVLLVVNVFWFIRLFGHKKISLPVGNLEFSGNTVEDETTNNVNNLDQSPVKFEMVCSLKNLYCCDLYTYNLKTKLYKIFLQLNTTIKDVNSTQFNGKAIYENTTLVLIPYQYIQANGKIASFCLSGENVKVVGFRTEVSIKEKDQFKRVFAPLEIKMY